MAALPVTREHHSSNQISVVVAQRNADVLKALSSARNGGKSMAKLVPTPIGIETKWVACAGFPVQAKTQATKDAAADPLIPTMSSPEAAERDIMLNVWPDNRFRICIGKS
jgi:hypothetical protein